MLPLKIQTFSWWLLTAHSESYEIIFVTCVLMPWHMWICFSYVVGSSWVVSWPAWHASSRAISPRNQACRACQLNHKHPRFRGRTRSNNSSFLEYTNSFTFFWCQTSLTHEISHSCPAVRNSCPLIAQNSFAPRADALLSHITPFDIIMG